jgi:hypothetical protein
MTQPSLSGEAANHLISKSHNQPKIPIPTYSLSHQALRHVLSAMRPRGLSAMRPLLVQAAYSIRLSHSLKAVDLILPRASVPTYAGRH